MVLQKFLTNPATLGEGDALLRVLEVMSQGRHPYRVLVTNGEGRVVGIITGRRILEVIMGVRGTGLAEKKGLRGVLEESVKIFMDESHETFTEDIGIGAILRFMVENSIGYAVIVDQSRRLRGTIHEVAVLERLRGKRFGAIVGDYMSKGVVSVDVGSSLGLAARTMVEKRIRRLPILDSEDKLAGILTIGDILRFIFSKAGLSGDLELDLAPIALEEAAPVRKVVSASPFEDIGEALERLLDNEVSGMPVVDKDGRVLGVASRIDILKAVASVMGIESLKAEIDG